MGEAMAPSLANIAVGKWELEFVYGKPVHAPHIMKYRRFIYDIFIPWDSTDELSFLKLSASTWTLVPLS